MLFIVANVTSLFVVLVVVVVMLCSVLCVAVTCPVLNHSLSLCTGKQIKRRGGIRVVR